MNGIENICRGWRYLPISPKTRWSETPLVREPANPKVKKDSYKRPTCPKARKSDNPIGRKPASPKTKNKAHKSEDPIVRRPNSPKAH
jgi:hypothetical protein